MNVTDQIKGDFLVDKYVIYLLYHGKRPTEVAKILSISRGQVYRSINRSKELLVMLNLLDISI